MEIELSPKEVKTLNRITSTRDWDIVVDYFRRVRESERNKLEKELSHDETNLIRGSIKRLKRVLELRETVQSETAVLTEGD